MKILNQTQDEYLEENYQRLRKSGQIFLVVGLVIGLFLLAINPFFGIILGGAIAGIGLERFKRASRYKEGMEGEKAVVNALQELDDSWWLINDVKLASRGGNIDHILLSPKGIFVLETKNFEGSIKCYGDEWSKKRKRQRRFFLRYFPIDSPSKQAKFGAFSLRRLLRLKAKLDIPVIPICVFTNPEVKLKIVKPTVKIVKLKDLVEFLQKTKSKRLLKEEEINSISKCILNKINKNEFL